MANANIMKTENWFITKVLIWILVIVLIVSVFSCAPKHTPRYDKYDKNGLIKSSTPLYLDKTKGKRIKSKIK